MAVIVKGKNAKRQYTVRYWHDGRQREKSFATYREATDFKVKAEHDIREQTFVDPKVGNVPFRDAAERWVASLTGASSTKAYYRRVLRLHINPVFGDRTLRAVANDRDGVQAFLLNSGLGDSQRNTAYIILRAVANDAVTSGKLPQSRINRIALPTTSTRAEFVFPTSKQLNTLAGELPESWRPAVWLMRGCGLRIGEALAVHSDGFRNGTLRLREQLLQAGGYGPLKHRRPDDHRDVPVPAYVAEMAAARFATAGGYWFEGVPRKQFERVFRAARKTAGLPDDFTPHSLRHVYASVALSNGVPITDVSHWLGHQSIQTTFKIYGHLVPSAWDNARNVLDQEYESWASDESAG